MNSDAVCNDSIKTIDWQSASPQAIELYKCLLDESLVKLSVQRVNDNFLCDGGSEHTVYTDNLYEQLLVCMLDAASKAVGYKSNKQFNVSVAGWNEFVCDKHAEARHAFLYWVSNGRPKEGPLLREMQITRATFKQALRYCRQHAESLKADKCEQSLNFNDGKQFWKNVYNMSNSKATNTVSFVGDVSGYNIIYTWRCHFERLYNTLNDVKSKDLLFNRRYE